LSSAPPEWRSASMRRLSITRYHLHPLECDGNSSSAPDKMAISSFV
jgi:hypothetical protein